MNQRELILKRLEGTDPTNKVELIGFDSNVISELITEGLIIRTKERGFGGTLSQYYLAQIEVKQ